MNENKFMGLVDAHPRITWSGFKIGRRGFAKSVHEFLEQAELEELKQLFPAFRLCCDHLRWRKPLLRGSTLTGLKMEVENWAWSPPFAKPEIPLGVVMLAAIHVGYQIQQVRGSYDGRIVRYHG